MSRQDENNDIGNIIFTNPNAAGAAEASGTSARDAAANSGAAEAAANGGAANSAAALDSAPGSSLPGAQPGAARQEPQSPPAGSGTYGRPAGFAAYSAPPKKKKRRKTIVIAALIIVLILIISAVVTSLISGGSDDADANYGGGSPYIGVLYVSGTISESSSESDSYQQSWLLRQIDYMAEDDSNKGIMLYVNSPGGSVYASDELYLKLMDYKETTERPLYAYFAETAASGAYYISACADKITANRNCTTGSIGVYLGPIIDASALLDKVGIDVDIIKSGENKAMGNGYEPLTDEQRAIYQEYVDEAYEQFVGIVAEGRGMDEDTVRQIADGRVYSAAQAVENGLIDGISDLEEAEYAMLKENGLSACGFVNVAYTPKTDLYSLLTGKSDDSSADAASAAASGEVALAADILNGDYTPQLMYMMQ